MAHFADRWEDYLDGALDAATVAELDAHLGACPQCRRSLEEARVAGRLLRAALDPAPQPRDGFWLRVRAGIEAAQSGPEAFWASLELLARRLTLGASLAVLLLGAFLLVHESDPATRWVKVNVEPVGVLPEPPAQPLDNDDVLLAVTGQQRFSYNGANGRGRR